jgi:formate/nitrite transporter FocA (FNT family)
MTQRAIQNAAGAAPELRALLEGLSAGPVIGIGLLFMFFVMLVVGTTFGMFGGLFGALLFRKSAPPVTPPPIPPAMS